MIKILIAGDFNAEEKEVILKAFMELYDLRNLVKEKNCFKSVGNPSCVDLFLPNCSKSFQETNNLLLQNKQIINKEIYAVV